VAAEAGRQAGNGQAEPRQAGIAIGRNGQAGRNPVWAAGVGRQQEKQAGGRHCEQAGARTRNPTVN